MTKNNLSKIKIYSASFKGMRIIGLFNNFSVLCIPRNVNDYTAVAPKHWLLADSELKERKKLARLYTAVQRPFRLVISITAAGATTSFSGACSLCYNVSRYRTAALPVRDIPDLPAAVSTPAEGPLINSTAVLLRLLPGPVVSGQSLVTASACTSSSR